VSLTRGSWIGLLLIVLGDGCSVRDLSVLGKGDGGHGHIGLGGHGGGPGGSDGWACKPDPDTSTGGRGMPALGVDGNGTPGAPALLAGRPNPLGAAPKALAIGDLDGDGRPDLVVSGASATGAVVSVLLNAGDGLFASRIDHPVRSAPTSVALGDLNGDRQPDIVAAGGGGPGVDILINQGQGKFVEFAYCACGGLDPTVTLADLDDNGTLDLIVASRRGADGETPGDLVVLLNEGSLFAKTATHYPAGFEPHSLAVADVSGDGHADVVTAGTCGGSVLLNGGGGGLMAATSYWSVRGRVGLHDMDADGRPDIVHTDRDRWTVEILPNAGAGRFLMALGTAVLNPVQTAAGDVDGDGKPDLVVATEANERALSVLLNQGDLRFTAPFTYRIPEASGPVAIGTADFDGDGRLDVAATGDASVTVFLNRPR
jgi:hypothetical protein